MAEDDMHPSGAHRKEARSHSVYADHCSFVACTSPLIPGDAALFDTSSILSGFSFVFSITPLSDSIVSPDDQPYISRFTTGSKVLNEVNQPMCWRGDECELADGLKQGIETVAQHLQTQADLVDQRVSPFQFHISRRQPTNFFQTRGLQHGSLEALKVS